MSDTKTTTSTSTNTAKPKMPEAFQSLNDASRKAFMAYVEASSELGAQFDLVARAQVGHLAQANKDTAALISATIESSVKAREAARKATIELIEGAFTSIK